MRPITKMFVMLLLLVTILSLFQYTLVEIRRNYIRGYAASFGGKIKGDKKPFAKPARVRVKQPKPKNIKHENLLCSQNVCSFTVANPHLFERPLTIVVDRATLMEECLQHQKRISEAVCLDFKEAGWDIITSPLAY